MFFIMGIYNKFKEKYFALCQNIGKEQYLVPYLMSSHPGSTMADAIELALYLKKSGYSPEQVQDFYPTPGTASTCMFYTGLDPFTGKKVYIPENYEEKQMQRALLQFNRPENHTLIRKALISAGREELIGYGADCIVPPSKSAKPKPQKNKSEPDAKNKKSSLGNKKAPRKPYGKNTPKPSEKRTAGKNGFLKKNK